MFLATSKQEHLVLLSMQIYVALLMPLTPTMMAIAAEGTLNLLF